MKQETLVNVPEIQKNIKEIHEKFIKQYSPQIEKVSADNRLLADIILTRLYRVAICFKVEGVIDNIKIEEQSPCKKILLQKNGYDNYVYMVTNGKSILLEGYDRASNDFLSDMMFIKKRFDNIHDDYDWTAFSKELLDYIHSTIYFRKEAAETKMNTMFENPSGK